MTSLILLTAFGLIILIAFSYAIYNTVKSVQSYTKNLNDQLLEDWDTIFDEHLIDPTDITIDESVEQPKKKRGRKKADTMAPDTKKKTTKKSKKAKDESK